MVVHIIFQEVFMKQYITGNFSILIEKQLNHGEISEFYIF